MFTTSRRIQVYKASIYFRCALLELFPPVDCELRSSHTFTPYPSVSAIFHLLLLAIPRDINMTRLAIAFLLPIFTWNAVAAPTFHKRIAQTISASTQKWEAACLAAGGADKCNPLSITAFSTLLAAPGPCEQQDAADAMIDLAKTLNNDSDMIKFTQIFVQQPRNSPNSVAIPYCQTAPKNNELSGLFQCQFQGSDQTTFVGGLKVGENGTIPFGQSSVLTPAGSCLAHPSGPIADGTQLVDQVDNPGTIDSSSSSSTTNTTVSATSFTSSASSFVPSPSATTSLGTSANDGQCGDGVDSVASSAVASSDAVMTATTDATTASPTPSATQDATSFASATSSTAPSAAASTSSTEDFHLKNGEDAQALNAKFALLTADSPCNAGDQVCVGSGFGQCVSSKLVITQCASGTSCFALPLVNKAGTSIACTTQADVAARIQATGAQGGITGI
ncbi:hypothetical protein BDY19DRAFT_964651 [Irpex rosettiformis]|uniref:Uncharacterized protein n=1 Tax=Irpex rosettiformis TaxID=378272 RepID=A0ACB8TUV4_9APHY|nr:hypothetical protein BDY19DRAFT_964651 [Irpex rosettiformis]